MSRFPAVGVLGDLPGDGLQLGVGLVGEVVGVGIEGHVTGQGDGDVLVGGTRTGRVIQSPGVALDRNRACIPILCAGARGGWGAGTVFPEGLVQVIQGLGIDARAGGLGAVDHADHGEAGLGDVDGDVVELVDTGGAEDQVGGDRLPGIDLQLLSGRRDGP